MIYSYIIRNYLDIVNKERIQMNRKRRKRKQNKRKRNNN
jgi:hypothetical protein